MITPPPAGSPPLRPLSGKALALIAVGITALTAAAVTALWWAGTRGLTGPALVTARFEALKIGLSIGVGSGGVFALYLAWRRQQSTEIGLQQKERDQADVARAYELQQRVANSTEADAVERRITDLYIKAADQLGSEQAAVRLAGLYALERLGKNTESQREVILNVICAYLCMSNPPTPLSLSDEALAADPELHYQHEQRHLAIRQEQQVRATALRIVARHRRRGNPEDFWDTSTIDLVGVDLSRTDLSGVELSGANLTGARLWNVDLTATNLTGAELIGAELWNTDLAHTVLEVANLTGAKFKDCELDETNMFGSNLTGAAFDQSRLRETNLRAANLTGTVFNRGEITRVDLTGAELVGTKFENVELTDVFIPGVSQD